MGHAPEGLPRLISGMVVREMIEGLHVDDLFNCARSDALWEEVALSTLSRKLRFFALLQDRLDDPLAHGKFVEELRSRLAVAEKASKRPSFAIILCAEKHYDFGTIASCFPADITVVRVDVQCPVVAQRRGIKERLDASVCVLVFFDSPGAAFECEWSPYIECGVPAFTSTLFDMLKRSMPLCGGEDVHRHRNTGMPARFALYITSTFTSGVIFKRQPSMYDVGLCMLWTPRLRVYQGAVDDTHSAHAYWGAMTFGENVKAMCLKYAAWTTVQQLWRHLDTVRTSLGDISDALVLFFQDQELKAPVVEAICLAFDDAAVVAGTACSLALDSNSFALSHEPSGDAQNSLCVQTAVVVLVVAIR